MTLSRTLANALLAFAGLFILSASAVRADNVQDFSYTGEITDADPAPVTATFAFDETTYKIVGPWDFTTPVGTFSSSGVLTYTNFTCVRSNICYFTLDDGYYELVLQVPLTSDYPVGYYGGGPITSGTLTLFNTEFTIDGTITNVTQSTMPEPSALVCLSVTLAGLAAFQLRRPIRWLP